MILKASRTECQRLRTQIGELQRCKVEHSRCKITIEAQLKEIVELRRQLKRSRQRSSHRESTTEETTAANSMCQLKGKPHTPDGVNRRHIKVKSFLTHGTRNDLRSPPKNEPNYESSRAVIKSPLHSFHESEKPTLLLRSPKEHNKSRESYFPLASPSHRKTQT